MTRRKVSKHLIAGLLWCLCLAAPAVGWAQNFVDAAGRSVVVPDMVRRVLTAGPPADLLAKVVVLASPSAAVPDSPLRAALPSDTRFLVDPAQPFGSLDDPPSLNRLLGVVWLTGKLYPERLHFDAAEFQGYWKVLFGIQISQADINTALQ